MPRIWFDAADPAKVIPFGGPPARPRTKSSDGEAIDANFPTIGKLIEESGSDRLHAGEHGDEGNSLVEEGAGSKSAKRPDCQSYIRPDGVI